MPGVGQWSYADLNFDEEPELIPHVGPFFDGEKYGGKYGGRTPEQERQHLAQYHDEHYATALQAAGLPEGTTDYPWPTTDAEARNILEDIYTGRIALWDGETEQTTSHVSKGILGNAPLHVASMPGGDKRVYNDVALFCLEDQVGFGVVFENDWEGLWLHVWIQRQKEAVEAKKEVLVLTMDDGRIGFNQTIEVTFLREQRIPFKTMAAKSLLRQVRPLVQAAWHAASDDDDEVRSDAEVRAFVFLADERAPHFLAQRDFSGAGALNYFAFFGRVDFVQLALSRGAPLVLRSFQGWTALMSATENGQEEAAHALLMARVDVEAANNLGATALYKACELGHSGIVRLLLNFRANVNAESRGFTPLDQAYWNGPEVVHLLLEAKAVVGKGSDLLKACEQGRVPRVKLLLEQRASVDTVNGEWCTPLIKACQHGHTAVSQLLLQARAATDARDHEEQTAWDRAYGNWQTMRLLLKASQTPSSSPLIAACQNGDFGRVSALLRAQSDANSYEEKDWSTPLIVACRAGHQAIAQALVSKGAELETVDIFGATALFEASRSRAKSVASWLLSARAAANTANEEGTTPLQVAIKNGDEATFDVLFRARANLEASSTSLHEAISHGHQKVVHELLRVRAALEDLSEEGSTPLLAASSKGHDDVVALLLRARAKVDAAGFRRAKVDAAGVDAVATEGITPLRAASEKGHEETVKKLLQASANVDYADSQGVTPMHTASDNGHTRVAQLLHDAGADVVAANKRGSTALFKASMKGHEGVVRMLLEARAPVDAANESSATPLHVASQNGHVVTAELLLEAGSNLEVTNSGRSTALWKAAINKQTSVVRLLMGARAHVSADMAKQLSADVISAIPAKFDATAASKTPELPVAATEDTATGNAVAQANPAQSDATAASKTLESQAPVKSDPEETATGNVVCQADPAKSGATAATKTSEPPPHSSTESFWVVAFSCCWQRSENIK